MRTSTADGLDRAAARALIAAALLAAACGDDGGEAEEEVVTCTRDTATGPTTALALAVGTPVEGFVCPVNDADWYELALGPTDRLVRVRLGIVGDSLSPVEPTYAIWSKKEVVCSGAAEDPPECAELGLEARSAPYVVPDTVVAQPDPFLVGLPEAVEAVHCLEPGATYFLAVRDLNDDAADVRRAYALEVTASADPDVAEPNDAVESAIPVASGTTVTGQISCSGDRDFYAISAPAGAFIDVSLTSPVTGYEPRVEVLGPTGTLLQSQANLRGRFEPTSIVFCRVLPEAGVFYVAVRDDDGIDAEPEVPYTLTIRTAVDVDTNEPNNTAAEATSLPTVSCAGGNAATITGTLACGGDNDWFAVDLAGCVVGDLVEADVLVGEGVAGEAAWQLQQRVQAGVALIRNDPLSPCADDRQCDVLNRPCEEGLDCAGYLEACLASRGGFCAGATACLPGGRCGANQVSRAYRPFPIPSPIVGSPPANRATISAPILDASGRLYVRVSDFQADGGDAGATYRLRITARRDVDRNEPNNLFFNRLLDDTREDTRPNVPTPVPQCPATATGTLGYQNDVDWWQFPKRCGTGADCPLVLRMSFEGGDVPTAAVVVSDADRGPRFSRDLAAGTGFGAFIGGPDFCGYQFRDDSGPYLVEVFDVDETPEDLELSAREWDADQRYTICYEAPAGGGCPTPCVQVRNPETGGMECDSP